MKLQKDNESSTPAVAPAATPAVAPAATPAVAPVSPPPASSATPSQDDAHAPANMDFIKSSSAAPADAAAEDAGKGEGEGEGEQRGRRQEDQETSVQRAMRIGMSTGLRIVQSRKSWIVAGVMVLSVVGYQVGYTFYTKLLLTLSHDAMIEHDYAQVLDYVDTYESIKGRTPESLVLLARSEMFLGDYQKLGRTLASYDGDDPELLYLRAVGVYFEDPDAAKDTLAFLHASPDAKDRPYIGAARGVFSLLENLWNVAAPLLRDTRAVEGDLTTNRHLQELARLYFKYTELELSAEGPISFQYPRNANKHKLEFTPGSELFHNEFNVPLAEYSIADNMTDNNIIGIYQSLRLLAEIHASPDLATQIAVSDLTSAELARYIKGFYLAKAGRYKESATNYSAISAIGESTISSQYEAQALWMTQDGEAPNARVVERFETAMKLDPKNATAFNNAAFLQYAFGDLEKAAELIKLAGPIETTNKYIVLNRLLINAASGALDHKVAQVQIEGLLPAFPQSQTLLHLAVLIETETRNMSQAIDLLYRIRELNPSDPSLPLEIAARYRYIGRMFLAIQEMEDAHKQFPENQKILNALALYRAIRGSNADRNAAAALPPKSGAALHTKSILLALQNKYKEAAEAGQLALFASAAGERADIAVYLTRIYLRAGQIDEAEKALQLAQNNAPVSRLFGLNGILTALEYRIRAAQNLPVDEEVENALKIATNNKDVFAQIDLAQALIALGRPEPAVRALEKIRREQHGNIRTYDFFTALIAGYEGLGQDELAEETRQKRIAILAGKEDNAGTNVEGVSSASAGGKVFSSRADILKAVNDAIRVKDYDAAVELFTGLIDSKESKVEKPALNFQNRGALYLKLKKFEEAAEDFAIALGMKDQLSPKEIDTVHYNYINALARAGDYVTLEQEVVARLDQAAQAAEDFVHKQTYMRVLAAGLAAQGNHPKASGIYGDLIALYPRDVSSYISLSDSELALENFEEAVSALAKGLEIDPNNIRMHERLLKIYRQLGDDENARRELKIINDLRK